MKSVVTIVDNCVRSRPGQITVEELTVQGIFDPNHQTCKACGIKFPRRCMGLYSNNSN